MSFVYRRAKGATARRVGASTFLASEARGTLLRVSTSMAALWNLLRRPMATPAIHAVFRAAFPRVPKARLRADVAMMLRDLASEGILERVAPSRRRRPPRRA